MCVFFAIVFFVIAGIVLKGKQQIYNYVQGECSNPLGYFGDYDRIHVIAEQYLCSNECPCAASKLFPYALLNLDYALWPTNLASQMNTSTNGVINVTNCAPYQTYVRQEGLEYDNTVSMIEGYFGCSGICTKSKYYSFSDVTK